ncbi:MAG: thiamine diphosphokinase [Clostridia bacterium]|nr:thiamine diphosphokinase [Clostridia bacterium]
MQIAIILKAPSIDCVVKEENVIFADGAYRFLAQLGNKKVLAVVGDFDSLGRTPKGENIVSLEVEKNFTDGERAVRLAKEYGADEITIYGAYGGKIEHILGNIALLKIAKDLNLSATIKDENGCTKLISEKTTLNVKKDSVLSLIPYGGNCEFIKSENLYYPLDNLVLTPSDTRGISNVAQDENVVIEIKSGLALAIYIEK